MSEFTYDNLPYNPHSQIRLLRLSFDDNKRPQWSFEPPVHIPADFGEGRPPNFAALSYEWGDLDATSPFSIGGQRMRTRVNLKRFLKALPKLKQKLEMIPSLFWIDSICVNQNDEEERSAQIRLLGDIYSCAKHVISWLGPSADSSNLAMGYIQGVCKNVELSVNALLNRRYWTRLWMVQEIVLARKWLVACGLDIVNSEEFVSRLFSETRGKESQHSDRWKKSRAYALVRERAQRRDGGPSSLMDLMLRFFALESKYPVDKVRALLALCSDSHRLFRIDPLLRQLACTTEIANNDMEQLVAELTFMLPFPYSLTNGRERDIKGFMRAMLSCCETRQKEANLSYLAAKLNAFRMQPRSEQLKGSSTPLPSLPSTSPGLPPRATVTVHGFNVKADPFKSYMLRPNKAEARKGKLPKLSSKKIFLPERLRVEPLADADFHLPMHSRQALTEEESTQELKKSTLIVANLTVQHLAELQTYLPRMERESHISAKIRTAGVPSTHGTHVEMVHHRSALVHQLHQRRYALAAISAPSRSVRGRFIE